MQAQPSAATVATCPATAADEAPAQVAPAPATAAARAATAAVPTSPPAQVGMLCGTTSRPCLW